MTLTLDEAAQIFEWLEFCEVCGYSEWARAEGGGDVSVTITVEQYKRLTSSGTGGNNG
jgi:hypothetical protein